MAEYLERKAVLDVMLRAQTMYGAYMAIAHMKPADVVERKHGKWILVQDYSTEEIEDGEKYWVCSLCGCGSDSYDTTYHTNFCPNCGADMRGESDEES